MSAQYKSLLQWVAENVYAINGLDSPSGERVEIVYWCDEEAHTEIAIGDGSTVFEAFIRALNTARECQVRRKLAGKRGKTLVQVFADEEKRSVRHGKDKA